LIEETVRLPGWVKDGCGREADGMAGLPPAPEIAGAFRHLRFVPFADMPRGGVGRARGLSGVRFLCRSGCVVTA
jgi:hypothetical protein